MKKLKIGKKTGLKYFDIEDVRSWHPCYPPERDLKAGERYTAVSILNRDDIPFEDRLWIVVRNEICSDKLMKLFAVWCYGQTLKLNNPNPKSVAGAKLACSTAWYAVWSTSSAALSAAMFARSAAGFGAAVCSSQKEKLIEMIKVEGLLRVNKTTKGNI